MPYYYLLSDHSKRAEYPTHSILSHAEALAIYGENLQRVIPPLAAEMGPSRFLRVMEPDTDYHLREPANRRNREPIDKWVRLVNGRIMDIDTPARHRG